MSQGDVVVLGSGIEGLAAATTLAAEGRSVRVVDGNETAGGIAARFPITANYSAPGLLTDTSLARRTLLKSLGLEQAGLAWSTDEWALHVGRTGKAPLAIRRGDLAGFDASDSTAYAAWRRYVGRLSGFIVDVIDGVPPVLDEPGVADILGLAKKGLRLRSLGDEDMMELLRIVTLPARDWLDEQFTSSELKAGLVGSVLTGTVVGPRAAGTTALMLMREAARGQEPVGGGAALAEALVRRCTELGVVFHLGTEPEAVLVDSRQGRVTGVRCGPEHHDASLVVSALDPADTLLELVDPEFVPHHVENELLGWRRRGDTAIHLFACSEAPRLGQTADAPVDRLVTAGSLDQLERAADSLKYGTLPEHPGLDVRVWRGPQDAPSGGATLVVHIHGVPHGGDRGWSEEDRSSLRSRVVGILEGLSTGFERSLVADALLMPCDIEARFGLPGGHLYGGEQALDQLWVQRPAMALSRYSTPVEGLFLAGAGSHPGGPFLGGAGTLGARAALGG